MRYVCELCGYVYDPELGDDAAGIDAGTDFEDVPQIGLVLCAVHQRKILKQFLREKIRQTDLFVAKSNFVKGIGISNAFLFCFP